MPIFSRPLPLAFFVLFAMSALTSCDREGASPVLPPSKPDPRLAKKFSASAPWFCRIPYEYSKSETGKPDTIEKGFIIATGEDRDSTYAVLKKKCEVPEPKPSGSPSPTSENSVVAIKESEPKAQCRAILAAKTELCVAAPLFVSGPPVTGLWRCETKFSVGDREETLEEPGHTTADEAIAALFKECAELKDAEIGSTERRDACAEAIMKQKMTCKDLNEATPIPPKPPVKRRLTRAPKKN